MCKKRCVHAVSVVLLWAALLFPGAAVRAGAIISDHDAVAEFDEIPASVIEDIRSNYRIYYGHTSHGSQITNGLDLLTTENSLYAQPYFREVIDDLGDYGDTSWEPITRSYLNSHPDINIVMWSWCGGVTDNTEDGINAYLNAMNRLEQDYPDITFVYMTGHLDGTGPSGGLYVRNNQIRDYCRANNKVLFDFADIESYDPDGIYYPDEDDGCGWCSSWCSSHFCYTCSYCAHSHCFNCYLKGKAWWWMMATISGWSLVSDVDPEDGSGLPGTFELKQNYPNPFNPSTTIEYCLAERCHVSISVYNVLGERVTTLVDKAVSAGRYTAMWDGRDSRGRLVSSGLYFCRLRAADLTETRKMLLLR